jgi:Ni,Fe-hydrogenase III small subunit
MPWRELRQIARVGTITEPAPDATSPGAVPEAQPELRAIAQDILAVLGHALAIRAVDAGSCNGCELEMQALNNPYYNIEGLGIKFVASPRHADLLLVTGPVSAHMEAALLRTYEAMPAPKRVVAVGECACNGGVFGESYASRGRIANVLPVDVEIPGCPPPPLEMLRGILRALR